MNNIDNSNNFAGVRHMARYDEDRNNNNDSKQEIGDDSGTAERRDERQRETENYEARCRLIKGLENWHQNECLQCMWKIV